MNKPELIKTLVDKISELNTTELNELYTHYLQLINREDRKEK